MADGDLVAIARAYDAIAPEYDDQLAQNPVALYMRTCLHDHLSRVFRSGDRVLDLTAGTGVDACFLASSGIQVTALDVSPGMMAELERSAERRALHIETHVLPVERIAELELSDLDGAISTFGGLNTVHGLGHLARDLASCLKPHGRVILHALGDFCLWQTVRHLLHGRLKVARETDFHLAASTIRHRFYNPYALWRDEFAPSFSLRGIYALSVVAAPPLVERFPPVAPTLFALDRIAGRVVPTAGDFFVLDMEKRSG